ncbi:GPI-anchored adhesin-like protein [Rhynchospora pubera]|uniref:GPI-anchored adhesin-like protein n=1 Tax=Rhynchospora pubera TaxID=906938 RepID=A0AAV8CIT8_9POAL|nr:GPI-anchored adhesin-like protein [Rhynchospora pubera]
MDTDAPLDYAYFQLSPKRSRCELFVSGSGRTEKIASGFLKPFVTHLKVAEEQSTQPYIRLQVEKRGNGVSWFNKGTLERFVRFVSTPEVMELANTLDAEMSQLEGARKIYSQGSGDHLSSGAGQNETTSATSADITKKELLKAIDVRMMAVKQDLMTACTRASSAGFTLDTVSNLLLFSDQFGANRLNEACTKFISLCQRRPDLVVKHQQTQSQCKEFDDSNLRASSGSDMSIDEPEPTHHSGSKPQKLVSDPEPAQHCEHANQPEAKEKQADLVQPQQTGTADSSTSGITSSLSRRLSVQDRISMFEKQASTVPSGVAKGAVSSSKPEHRRVPSNTSLEKSVLRRWSGASDMSIDLGASVNSDTSDRKDIGTPAGTPTSEPRPVIATSFSPRPEDVSPKATLTEVENPNAKLNPSEISSQSRDCAFEKEHSVTKEVHGFVRVKENQHTAVTQFKTFQKVNVSPAIVPEYEAEQVLVKDIEVATVSVGPVMQRDQEELLSQPRESPSDNVRVRDPHLNGVSVRKTENSDKKSRVPTNHAKAVQRKSGQAPSEMLPQQIVGKQSQERTYDVVTEESVPISKTEVRGIRQPMGNNELQMKAEELEKLFEAHKLRVQNENVPSARRNPKPKDIQAVKEITPTKNIDFDTSALLKMVESPDSGAHSLPEELRGKSYEKYTVKREAKLKAEWRSKRQQKEASLKAMQDSLEKSRAEMKVRFSRSETGRTLISRKMSFGSHLELRDKDQVTKFMTEDEDEDQSHSDNLSADGSSISADSRKHASSKSLSNTTPRGPSAVSIPKSSSRSTITSSNSLNRRAPTENPLAQSVPNFSDLRKENTKPSAASMRANNARAQVMKNYARSKSISEETANSTPVKEDVSRRTQSMRKSMVSAISTTNELKDISTLSDANNANFGFNPLKNGTPNSYQSYSYEVPDNGLMPQPVLFHDPIKDGNEDFDTEFLEEENPNPNLNRDFQADSDNDNSSFDYPGAESGPRPDRNFSQFAQFYPYQYQNETSDTDAFADSPMGSPGSWNSLQVRKKWGAAQAPIIGGTNMSGRKDMAKGFKRLLKFGRKTRGGTDGVNDWVSAASTTSEGDDDILEVGDVGPTFGGVPSGEEFRRSNLGYSLTPYDGFTESGVFGDQVQTMRSTIPTVPASFKLADDQISGSALKAPRSFFSLSSFRSKGAESRLR